MKNKRVYALGVALMLGVVGCGTIEPKSNTVPEVTEVVATEEPTEVATEEVVEFTETEVIEVEPTEAVEVVEIEPTETTETVEATPAPAFTVEAKTGTKYATQSVNVRKGPSTDYDKAGSLSLNEGISITGQANTGWYEFEKNGEKVYVSDKYVSDTKTEVKQTATKDNSSNNTNEAPPTQNNKTESVASNESSTDMPGIVFLEEDPEYITEVTSSEQAAAEQIAARGWEVGGTYVKYNCDTSGFTEPKCSKETWYVVSPTEINLVSHEDVTYEEYLAAGGAPVPGY